MSFLFINSIKVIFMKIFSKIGISLVIIFISCTKEKKLPTINTIEISHITDTTAISGGTISSDGGSPIIERGICWDTTENPTLADNHYVSAGTSLGQFEGLMNHLLSDQIYYVRAYAKNHIGIDYGYQKIFKTKWTDGKLLIDPRDGKAYKTITINGTVWLDENLNYRPANGGSWYYNNDSIKYWRHGRLYDWETAINIAPPPGWRLPTYDEIWFFQYTNSTIFQGGYRNDDGHFSCMNECGYWWTQTAASIRLPYSNKYAKYRRYGLDPSYDQWASSHYRDIQTKKSALYVRCVKN